MVYTVSHQLTVLETESNPQVDNYSHDEEGTVAGDQQMILEILRALKFVSIRRTDYHCVLVIVTQLIYQSVFCQCRHGWVSWVLFSPRHQALVLRCWISHWLLYQPWLPCQCFLLPTSLLFSSLLSVCHLAIMLALTHIFFSSSVPFSFDSPGLPQSRPVIAKHSPLKMSQGNQIWHG